MENPSVADDLASDTHLSLARTISAISTMYFHAPMMDLTNAPF